jgi:hypothetical protein
MLQKPEAADLFASNLFASNLSASGFEHFE